MNEGPSPPPSTFMNEKANFSPYRIFYGETRLSSVFFIYLTYSTRYHLLSPLTADEGIEHGTVAVNALTQRTSQRVLLSF